MKYNFDRRLEKLSTLTSSQSQKLQNIRTWRLTSGLALFVLFICISAFPQSGWLLSITFIDFLAFIFLVWLSRKRHDFIVRLELWSNFLQRQQSRHQGIYKDETPFLPDTLSEEQQILSEDLHLFGSLSLFSSIDESLSESGRALLTQWMLNPLSKQGDILQRQTLIQNLTPFYWQILKVCLIGRQQSQTIATSTLQQDLDTSFVEPSFHRWLYLHGLLFPLSWSLVFLGWSDSIDLNPQWPFAIYMGFSLYSLKLVQHSFGRINRLSLQMNRLMPIFSQLEKLSSQTSFSELLSHVQKERPSQHLKRADRFISWLNMRNHPMLYLIINAICPWDFVICFMAENWRKKVGTSMNSSFQDLYHFEAIASLTLMARFQTNCWPQIHNESKLEFSEAFHPLIPREKAVPNTFSLKAPQRLALITGSNMSGKSTFMRTVALNQILALMGAPVFATSFDTHFANLRTCLKVTDSLESGYSTFYFEVRRMAEIVQQSQTSENFLFFVDEIFRGTNHNERIEGSRAILKSLAERENVKGFISTHDLELVELSEQYDSLSVWHFRDDVIDQKLTFSYKIQPGVGPTTNALIIMREAGLPV